MCDNVYREYKQKLDEIGKKDTPPSRMSKHQGSLPVFGKQTRMADREKLDALSLLREGLRYEGTGASHVFVILGASVSVQTVARALTRTCILACKVCKSLHCACAVCTDIMFTMSDNVLSCNESKKFHA